MEIPYVKICHFFQCYDTDVDKINLNEAARRFLASIALNPKKFDFAAFLKMIPVFAVFYFLPICVLGHMVHHLQRFPYLFFDVADDISIIVVVFVISFVVLKMSAFSPTFNEFCKVLGDFSHPDLGRARGVEALDKLFRKYVYAVCGSFVLVLVCSVGLYITDDCAPDEESICGFIFFPYLPYIDIYNSPSRQIVLILECLSPYTAGAVVTVYISQYMFLNEIIILRCDHLESIIRRIPKTDPKKRSTLIGRIVRYHNILLRIHSQVNQSMGIVYAFHLCVTPINMSILAYILVGKEVNVVTLVQFSVYTFVVILTCGCGERLSTHTSKLHGTIFKSIPFEDIKTAKDMQLILFRAKKPMSPMAGGITAVNHVLMVDIFKTVWSTVTFLTKTDD